MAKKTNAKRTAAKLTDEQRHARFVETARKIGASDDPSDFEKAFKKVVTAKKARP